jgi:hypothetical protein
LPFFFSTRFRGPSRYIPFSLIDDPMPGALFHLGYIF